MAGGGVRTPQLRAAPAAEATAGCVRDKELRGLQPVDVLLSFAPDECTRLRDRDSRETLEVPNDGGVECKKKSSNGRMLRGGSDGEA